MRKWLLQLICRHEWTDMGSIYFRERHIEGSRGVVEATYICPKCNKVKRERGYVA